MWTKILEKMYDSGDYAILTESMMGMIQMRANQPSNYLTAQSARGKPEPPSAKKLTREELTREYVTASISNQQLLYKDFLKVILDYQLNEHIRFLTNFTLLFKTVDDDLDGVVSENEFRLLIRQMNIVSTDEEVELLLHQVDPFNNQRMTYSEIVHLLSSHLVPGKDNSMIPLLEKFANDNQFNQMHEDQFIGMDDSGEMDELDRDPTNFRQESELGDHGEFPESRVEEA